MRPLRCEAVGFAALHPPYRRGDIRGLYGPQVHWCIWGSPGGIDGGRPASRGEGVIVRLCTFNQPGGTIATVRLLPEDSLQPLSQDMRS